MERVVIILGGAILAIITGIIGKTIGSNGKVKEETCGERRLTCNKLIDEKLQNMDQKLDVILSHMDKERLILKRTKD